MYHSHVLMIYDSDTSEMYDTDTVPKMYHDTRYLILLL